jgi:hypothetical protein
MSPDPPSFDHLRAMTERYGTFEHADHSRPRREHGFCTDDAARVLLVASREPAPTPVVRRLARGAMRFVADAQGVDGRARNRRAATGRWRGRHTVEDCWGRSLWGLGAAAVSDRGSLGADALTCFEHGSAQRSPWPRAMAFAALGAASVLHADPRHQRARGLLEDAIVVITARHDDAAAWRWPEPRLTYANAAVPDAMIAAGVALQRQELIDEGLELLAWLLDRETVDGHLSVTPVGGAGPEDAGPRFDQQPIEVAAMADAAARAWSVTGSPTWADAVRMADAWFDGDNDAGVVMWDPETGGGYDGLEPGGRNENQGAESTLALIATRQQARVVCGVGVGAAA